jgi:drug/metabolite transporter (DMT)-like permease
MPAADATPALPAPSARRTELWGMALGAFAATVWGLYLALARQGMAEGLTPLDIALFRYGTAGIVMLPWAIGHRRALAAAGPWRALALVLTAGPPFILLGAGGYLFAPLAHGAVIQPASVMIGGALLAWAAFGERPGPARITGMALVLAGIAFIAGPGLLSGGAGGVAGDVMFAAAGGLWAGFTVLCRRWSVAPLAAAALVSVPSGAAMILAAAAIAGPAHYAAIPAGTLAAQIAVQGVLTGVVAVIAFTEAARILGAGRAAMFPAIVPGAAILIGLPLTGELPFAGEIVGLLLVTIGLGVAVGLLRRRAAV